MPAVTDSYATAQEYMDAIDKTGAEATGEIDADLAATSRWIDRTLGRFFTQDAAAATRQYRGGLHLLDGGEKARWLRIDDLVSITSFKSDDNGDGTAEVTWGASDYQLDPLNAADGSEPRPYTHIYLPPWSTKGAFVANRLYEISAVFGWPAVPPAIKRATIYFTSILRLEGQRGISQVTDLGTIISANPQARHMMEQLAKAYSRKAYAA